MLVPHVLVQVARLGLSLKQVSEAGKVVSANSSVQGCAAGKMRRKQYHMKVRTSGKTCQLQLSCLVVESSFIAKQQARISKKQGLSTQGVAKACCPDKLVMSLAHQVNFVRFRELVSTN